MLWKSGSAEGQAAAFSLLAVVTALVLVASLLNYNAVPLAWFVPPMLVGGLILRFRPLVFLLALIAAAVIITVSVESVSNGMTAGRASTLVAVTLSAAIVLFEASRNRSGLPTALGEVMLVDLRDRLQAQGKVPPLPEGWGCRTAMISAGGTRFAGDFMVANLSEDETVLEMILVDVCGKGVAAGTQSLQLAGALGGLIGALPPIGLFSAANDFLLRQRWDDGFATAVHVRVDLTTGAYAILNAGHPPALRWDGVEWEVDGARGLALGIARQPEMHQTQGVLEPGEALMFYTDGVVESRSLDIQSGVAWLQETATAAVPSGFDQVPRKVLSQVTSGDDDRAILLLDRVDLTRETAEPVVARVRRTLRDRVMRP